MSGFTNEVVNAKNVDFSGGSTVSAKLVSNGQMLIGSTALNAGGTNINVGTMSSPSSSLTIGYSSPNITMEVTGAASGKVLQGAGVGVAPTYSTATYPVTAGTSGNVLTSDGTNWTSAASAASSAIGVEGYINTTLTLKTGDATQVGVAFDTVSWQVGGSNLNLTNGVYTVPASGGGKYLVCYSLTLTGLTASHTVGDFGIWAGGATITRSQSSPGTTRNANNEYTIIDSVIVNVTAAQTIFVSGYVSGGTKVVGFKGLLAGSQTSYISITRLFA